MCDDKLIAATGLADLFALISIGNRPRSLSPGFSRGHRWFIHEPRAAVCWLLCCVVLFLVLKTFPSLQAQRSALLCEYSVNLPESQAEWVAPKELSQLSISEFIINFGLFVRRRAMNYSTHSRRLILDSLFFWQSD